jgi:hypothetical protein
MSRTAYASSSSSSAHASDATPPIPLLVTLAEVALTLRDRSGPSALVERGFVADSINYRLLGCTGPDLVTACTPAAIAGISSISATWLTFASGAAPYWRSVVTETLLKITSR